MFFHPKNLKSENNNPRFNILLHTQSIVCATVDSQCLEYLVYITLSYALILHAAQASQRKRKWKCFFTILQDPVKNIVVPSSSHNRGRARPREDARGRGSKRDLPTEWADKATLLCVWAQWMRVPYRPQTMEVGQLILRWLFIRGQPLVDEVVSPSSSCFLLYTSLIAEAA